jgi:hypothetical protein
MSIMASRLRAEDFPDFFPTPPWGFRAVAEIIRRLDPAARTAWECACGAGHGVHGLSETFEVFASDAFDYGWGHALHDFIDPWTPPPFEADWIITNPPFADKVDPFIRMAYGRARRGAAMLLQLRAMEGQKRHGLFQDIPLTAVAPFAERLPIFKGRYDPTKTTATAYAWFIFQKTPVRSALAPAGGVRIPIPPGTLARLTRPTDAAFAVGA